MKIKKQYDFFDLTDSHPNTTAEPISYKDKNNNQISPCTDDLKLPMNQYYL